MGKSKGSNESHRLSYSAGAFGNDVFYATLSTYFYHVLWQLTCLTQVIQSKNSHYVLLITNIIAILRILEVFMIHWLVTWLITLILSMVNSTMGSWWWYHQFYALLLLFTDLGGLNKNKSFLVPCTFRNYLPCNGCLLLN